MSLSDALAADRAGELELAAALYEAALSGDKSLPIYLNLALLYWQATDPGLAAAEKLSPAFMKQASLRAPELLDEAERRFSESTAVRFWKRYIAWADLGDFLSPEECRQLLREDPSVLVPAMYLFSLSSGNEAAKEADVLLAQSRGDGTTGSRYVASVLQAVKDRAGTR